MSDSNRSRPRTRRHTAAARRLTPAATRSARKRLLSRLLDGAHDLVYRYEFLPVRHTVYVTGAVKSITGHTAAEFYADGNLTAKAVHPDDLHLVWTPDGPTDTRRFTIRWVHPDGRIVWAEHRRVPIYDRSTGELVAIEGIARDVTDRVHTQEQLRVSQEQLRRLAASLQTAREEERTAVARELHDELGQTVTALRLEIARMVDLLRGAHVRPGTVDRLQSLAGLADIAVATVRRIATSLRPAALDHLGLADAVRWEAAAFQARSGLRCHVVNNGKSGSLTADQETAFFRIFQEALTNIARHAKASALRVRLSAQRGVFELRVQDNGRGITRTEAADPGAIGLLGMRERAAQIGASIDIAGRSGRGTTVTVRIKVPARRRAAAADSRHTARRRH